jgi:hypothetical protein
VPPGNVFIEKKKLGILQKPLDAASVSVFRSGLAISSTFLLRVETRQMHCPGSAFYADLSGYEEDSV